MKGLRFLSLVFLGLVSTQLVFAQNKLELSVVPGKNWERTMWWFLFPIKKAPQIAAWVETLDGKYVTTLLVTSRAAEKNWIGSPAGGRPESLPVWYASSNLAVDAESSATPLGKTELKKSSLSLVTGKEYVVRLEVNHSFDYNTVWTKKAKPGEVGFSGVNGQPSLVYECSIIAGSPNTIKMTTSGIGSVDGSDGKIIPGIEGLTTALSIIKSAEVKTSVQ